MPSNKARQEYRERNRELLNAKNKEYKARIRAESPEIHEARVQKQYASKRLRRLSDPDFADRVRAQVRASGFKHKYGIDYARRDEMAAEQGHGCGVCRTPLKFGGAGGAVMDHCHVSGRLRGILCATCNKGLGQLGDTVAGLEAALAYLKKTA
jgi:hypothetical protein